MLHRLIERARRAGRGFGFQAYLTDLQSRGRTGVPTVHEAQLDYRTLIQRENPYWMI